MPLGSSSAAPVTRPGPSMANSDFTDQRLLAMRALVAPLRARRPANQAWRAPFRSVSAFRALAADLNVSPERANDRDSRTSFAHQSRTFIGWHETRLH